MTHTVETIPEHHLTREDDAAIAALLKQAFTTDFYGRSYFQQRHHVRLVIRDEGRIIAHIGLCLRDVRLGAKMLTVIGIGDVATDPAQRGQGLASQILKDAISVARAGPADFLMLFGDRPMYRGHGFVSQPNSLTYVSMEDGHTCEIKTEPDDTLMIYPLGEAEWDAAAPLDLMGHKF